MIKIVIAEAISGMTDGEGLVEEADLVVVVEVVEGQVWKEDNLGDSFVNHDGILVHWNHFQKTSIFHIQMCQTGMDVLCLNVKEWSLQN